MNTKEQGSELKQAILNLEDSLEDIRLYLDRTQATVNTAKTCLEIIKDQAQPTKPSLSPSIGILAEKYVAFRPVVNRLNEAGYNTLEDIASVKASELLKVKGIGIKTVAKLSGILKEHGLELKGVSQQLFIDHEKDLRKSYRIAHREDNKRYMRRYRMLTRLVYDADSSYDPALMEDYS